MCLYVDPEDSLLKTLCTFTPFCIHDKNYLGGRICIIHRIEGWVDPRAGLDVEVKAILSLRRIACNQSLY
jgi:hypothetical protein